MLTKLTVVMFGAVDDLKEICAFVFIILSVGKVTLRLHTEQLKSCLHSFAGTKHSSTVSTTTKQRKS